MPPSVADLAPRAQAVYRLGESLGFSLMGIAPAERTPYEEHIRRWLAAGRHGEMAYLSDQIEQRLDPAALVPGAASVICVGDLYAGRDQGTQGPRDLGEERMDSTPRSLLPPRGRIARYAHGDDYHRVMKKRLHELADALRERWPEHTFRTTVDTAPTLEREHARRAGLGWVGKHTLLIHPRLGSYFFLGEIITTLPLQSSDAPPRAVTDHCGSCTRCIDACPTRCITPHSVDASRCISYLTLEHRGPIAPVLHEPMGDWIAGCDVCQEVCPFNGERDPGIEGPRGQGKDFFLPSVPGSLGPSAPSSYSRRLPAIPLLDLLNWSADDRQRAFERSALKRLKLDQLKRNALIAAGNWLLHHDDPPLRARIEALANDETESSLVRDTARQALARVSPI
jgi:epoxyqueuosine reductase